ncbi:hypothetical protein TVAG_077190 [Trichomonas vaginalis G3]|uniref:Biogenesis of lysosome-related organelles complex 1 subunit 7 n=1 Tax=Trichomonas vaginalis (strain ATCC PRA-98 / G3) TaxID=412133 RepID=A2D9W6_TRIV3|nr:hypothetical protein TVAGG3_0291120 [Trichomonas vaginalis G3]EAY22972.1 hypothetical protein TVAG_077190 [Trichomonas vaginalis G3]KAI5527276.1 hypothetical protein TVAGG3_0291120 [Trichomonas vaginalis G3]|eukprot:XP_001583958.1 hypothetical protein [Trichomonas vaginalis G3]
MTEEKVETEEPQVEEKPAELPKDPNGELLKENMVLLLNAAQGIWKDALESQAKLTVKIDYLQESINQIKELSALPNYPQGIKHIQNSINRTQACKKRIAMVQARLNKLNQILNAPKQK